ncbi:MAG: beta-ketoacyl-ACP synthase II [Candidatus Marinimicrobia bacterium]|nr:beta-ketoacyl-ACP synthase II [Candidatus Neomarinimicrobiota bacterium]MCF7839414.1 beta-ketoacyl-ACP synthase II [Candidatus Neomarinimicrobiota bacterium]MCF7902941.1 beta-ketoacyl-ACP synthase II [Candidatus Neomarinimicrobiota bacterium]
MPQRVVITGMGVISPLGNSVETFWENLSNGKNGIRTIPQWIEAGYPVTIAGKSGPVNIDDIVDGKDARRMDPYCVYALHAANQAMEQSGLMRSEPDPRRVGVIVGSGVGGLHVFEEQHTALITRGHRRISPFFIPMMIPDIAAGYIAIKWGFHGPNFSVSSACATANHAIGMGLRTIRYGDADVMIVGASDATLTPMALNGFANMKALSTRNDDPEHASRPFDLNRDGFVMGEGAGIFVLESLEHAQKRGANILAELAGFGQTADAHHITTPAPDGIGAKIAMENALHDAQLTPEDIDYINAHGTSTPFNDKTETTAIKFVFGDQARVLSISSTKSMTGHLLGASGGVELVGTVQAIREGVVPPTINYQTPDPGCDLDYTVNQAKERPIRAALSNSFGFGGHNAVLIAKAFHS